MGECVGNYKDELVGGKLCKVIEEGEIVSYNLVKGKLVKSVCRNNRWIEDPI
jgi:hypothetical protein